MRKAMAVMAVGLLALAPLVASAQPRPGGRQGGPGGGPPGMGGGRQGGMRLGRNMPVTLATTPLATLKAVFKLTPPQEKKIEAIQQKGMQSMMALMPQGGPGQRPDRAAFEKAMPKMVAAMKKVDVEINAALTPAQRAKAPAMLKEMGALRGAGLPMSLAGSLKLTPQQISKLDAIGKARMDAQQKAMQGGDRMQAMGKMRELRDAANKKAMGVLNASQKAAVEKWEKEHPRRQFGGPGGPGMMGAGPGGPGGPGMMGGGPGGPGRPGGPGAGGGRRGPGR